MNTPLFIARRIGGQKAGKTYTSLIKRIAIVSVALGLAVMIVSMAVVTGFQREIRDKVIGFGAHIQITHYDFNTSFEPRPISSHQEFLPDLLAFDEIRHIQVFATKPGLIRTDDEIHGVIMKGIGPDFDWSFFSQRIVSGQGIRIEAEQRSDGVVISRFISRRMQIDVGDDLFIYFIQDPPRIRRLSVEGVYDTDVEELDKLFILADIRHIQTLNDWEEDQIGGFEVLVSDYDHIQDVTEALFDILPYHLDAKSIRQLYPQIFDWLALLDMNVYVIIALMIVVAGINMITTLLITVLEKINAIGTLKAVGASNTFVQRVFLYQAATLISKGLLWGNLLALVLLLMQKQLGIIELSPESYYVSVVPVNIDLVHILLLNGGTFLVCMIMLILPSHIITRISPVKAIIYR